MNRFSSSDWLFAVVLWAIAIVAALVHFSLDRAFWSPFVATLSCVVAAAIVVNLYRYWRACSQLRKRIDG